MGFKLYKSDAFTANIPLVRITSYYVIVFNMASLGYMNIRDRSYVLLAYDSQHQTIGIKPINQYKFGARILTMRPSQRRGSISVKTFAEWAKIDLDKHIGIYKLRQKEGYFCFRLKCIKKVG